eukprot:g8531.t1
MSEVSTVSPSSCYLSMYQSPAHCGTPARRTSCGTPLHHCGRSPHPCGGSPIMWNDDFADHSLRSWMHRNQAPELLWELFVLYASPLAFTPIDFESETDRIVGSARDSGRLQTGQVRISLGAASSSSLTKMLTQSHARRSGGLILHLAAHGDEAGGLVLENSKGNGEAYRCTHEKLRQILQMGDRGLRGVSLLFLSSCSSKQLAQVFLECGCQHVIATSSPVLDATARAFTERFYGALFVGKSIVEAFEHTRKALLASSVREVADQSNVYHLLSAEGVGQVVPDVPERPERPGSRESEIGGFQDGNRSGCSFQEQLTFLPPEVEDFFRPPEMQQVMNVLLNRRACAVHGCEGIGKSALLIETARFAASPGRRFSGNVVHVRLHDRSNAVKTIKDSTRTPSSAFGFPTTAWAQEAVDFCSARLPCFLAETPGGPNGHARCRELRGTELYLGFIKMKCRLRKPSKERNFQNLCLLLNPDLQACVDEINHKETEKMLAKKKESVKDPDAYDDGSSSSSSDDEPCESDGDASVHEEIRGKEIPESLPEPDKDDPEMMHDSQLDAGEAYVTRDQQLQSKKARKQNRGKGQARKKKGGKKKGGKKNRKGQVGRKKVRSPIKKRRQVLKSASSVAGHDCADDHPRRKRRTSAKAAAEEQPAVVEALHPPVPEPKEKAKAKPKGRAKAKAAVKSPKAKAAVKSPKAKAAREPKTAAKRGRKRQTAADAIMNNPDRSYAVVSAMMHFAQRFPKEGDMALDAFKTAVRAELREMEWYRPNIYWTRNGCGVTQKRPCAGQKASDIHTFSFNTAKVPCREKLAIAVFCAEAAAWGLENTWEGYEKGGFEIRKLKANAAIALHMLSTGNNDLEWLRNE